jgi:hypothetical protein
VLAKINGENAKLLSAAAFYDSSLAIKKGKTGGE